jgi:hypothetical protein
MADNESTQPDLSLIFDQFEHSLEQWRDHLARLGEALSPGETSRLKRQWDEQRLAFEVACLHNGLEIPGLEAVGHRVPNLRDFNSVELEITLEALRSAQKFLTTILTDTKGRMGLLENLLDADKPQRMRKILEKMRTADQALQTRLLGLEAYVDQFHLAELPNETLASSAQIILEQTHRLEKLTQDNDVLEEQIGQMRRWLAESRLSLDRMPPTPPPSPGAMREISVSSANSESDKALASLFTNHEKLKDARAYLENHLREKGKTDAG